MHVFLTADNETKLQAKFLELVIETQKAVEVIAIYPRGSKVVAWVRVESRHVSMGSTPEKKISKKKKPRSKKS